MIHVVTYTTHAKGTFEELIKNPFGINVEVIGWGSPWKGFSDKFNGVRKYIENLPDEDIIVFLDGWDTIINKDPSDVDKLFKQMNCDILVSKEGKRTPVGPIIFGSCLNGIPANSGMYMGKVHSVKKMLDILLSQKCKDDQVNLNKFCKKIEHLKIDEDEIIFQNTIRTNKTPSGIFVSFPGTSKGRTIRAIKDYLQFLINYIILLIILGIYFFPKYISYLLIIGYSILLLFYIYSDKSCY